MRREIDRQTSRKHQVVINVRKKMKKGGGLRAGWAGITCLLLWQHGTGDQMGIFCLSVGREHGKGGPNQRSGKYVSQHQHPAGGGPRTRPVFLVQAARTGSRTWDDLCLPGR